MGEGFYRRPFLLYYFTNRYPFLAKPSQTKHCDLECITDQRKNKGEGEEGIISYKNSFRSSLVHEVYHSLQPMSYLANFHNLHKKTPHFSLANPSPSSLTHLFCGPNAASVAGACIANSPRFRFPPMLRLVMRMLNSGVADIQCGENSGN